MSNTQENDPASRLIEHTAENGWKHTHNVTIESQEEEQDASYDLYMEIKTLMDDFNEDFILRKIKEKFTITRKP